MILFSAFKWNTCHEDVELLNLTCKLSPHGAGYDEDDISIISDGAGDRERRKRYALDGLREENKRKNKTFQILTTGIIQRFSTPSDYRDSSAYSLRSSYSVLSELVRLTKERDELMALKATDALTLRSIDLLDRELVSL